MEVSGVVLQQISCLSAAATDCRSSLSGSFTSSRDRFSGKPQALEFPLKRVSEGRLSHEFVDRGHLQYYSKPTTWCGSKGDRVKDKKKIKKRTKMIKELTKDLNIFSSMRFGLDPEAGLVGQVQNKAISEATEILVKQLKQLKAEEKELKKRKKEEKAKAKAMKMRTVRNGSESSSSESSESDCDQVIDMNRQQNLSLPVMQQTATQLLQQVSPQTAIATLPILTSLGENMAKKDTPEESCNGFSLACNGIQSNINNVLEVTTSSEKRIEVCMGGKCKKLGGKLLEEFQRVMGYEGLVVGCKCMGKCRNGPNVRVLNQNGQLNDSVRTPLNPLYTGVGLQDVAAIVSGLIGEECAENMGLAESCKGCL